MLVSVMINLDEKYHQVLKDISLIPESAQPLIEMGGSWGDRAKRLAYVGLVEITHIGYMRHYSLTETGMDALRQLEKEKTA